MTIRQAIHEYRLPEITTTEKLEESWRKVLTFGDKVVTAGYFYSIETEARYYAAIYEFTNKGEKHSCESEIKLTAVSEVEFEDDGHAIEWALRQK